MDFKELVSICRKEYPEFNWMNDFDLLFEMERRMTDKLQRDDLTENEKEFLKLLPEVREYLQ